MNQDAHSRRVSALKNAISFRAAVAAAAGRYNVLLFVPYVCLPTSATHHKEGGDASARFHFPQVVVGASVRCLHRCVHFQRDQQRRILGGEREDENRTSRSLRLPVSLRISIFDLL
jgi:hypothetical protein